jgi:hypothetical protein
MAYEVRVEVVNETVIASVRRFVFCPPGPGRGELVTMIVSIAMSKIVAIMSMSLDGLVGVTHVRYPVRKA